MLNPEYILPSRNTVSNSLIPRLYEPNKDVVLEHIKKAAAVCLTTDCWTSVNNTSFMAVTANF